MRNRYNRGSPSDVSPKETVEFFRDCGRKMSSSSHPGVFIITKSLALQEPDP